MPSHARRWSLKIVEPQPPTREAEISGGIKNALERGESLAKAKQSFLNAGYNKEEVELSIQKIPVANRQLAKPLIEKTQASSKPATPIITTPKPPATPPQSPATPQVQLPQASSKKLIIILSVIGVIILIVATVLGIYWDKIF